MSSFLALLPFYVQWEHLWYASKLVYSSFLSSFLPPLHCPYAHTYSLLLSLLLLCLLDQCLFPYDYITLPMKHAHARQTSIRTNKPGESSSGTQSHHGPARQSFQNAEKNTEQPQFPNTLHIPRWRTILQASFATCMMSVKVLASYFRQASTVRNIQQERPSPGALLPVECLCVAWATA